MFADCDLERTIAGVAGGVFTHAGQLCIAGSRLFVERKAFDQVVSGLAGAAKSLKIGGAFDPETQVGPLISEKQMQRVTGLIQSGSEQGAELVTGGKRCGTGGYFVEPTVLANPRADARVLTSRKSRRRRTVPNTVWPPPCGHAISTRLTRWLGVSSPASSGSTAS